LTWLDHVSGRLIGNIVYQHHRARLRHQPTCGVRCVEGCDVRGFHEVLAEPVLPSEIAAAKAEEERFQALARGDFSQGVSA
jgi:hypothetical protein